MASAEAGGRPRRQVEIDRDGGPDRAAQQIAHAAHQLGKVGRLGLERLATGEGKQALGQRRTALGALRRAVDQAFDRGVGRQALAQELEVAQHGGQQVVEVVRHAAGELADRFQLLHVAQLFLGALALGNLRNQRIVGMLELRGALVDPPFQSVVHLLQAQLTLAQILEQCPGFVLAATALDGGAGDAQQRRRMERSFDERHVAQCLEPASGDGIALRPAAVIRHQHEGQVGPCRLARQPQRQWLEVGGADRLFGHQNEGDVVVESLDEFGKIVAWRAANAGQLDQRLRHRGIAPARRENQRAKLPFRGGACHSSCAGRGGARSPGSWGTPRNTP